MKTLIDYGGKTYHIDLADPLDISIPLRGDVQNVGAWGLEHPKITPHTDGDFTGKVSNGAAVNFNDVWFNPHAHGTHT
ncbi:MAG: cyclase family protein, partial [Pricia sp.]